MTSVRIESLAHRDARVAAHIHAVQIAAYAQEAELLGVIDFPPLKRMPADIQIAEERFIGAFIEETLVGSLSTQRAEQPEELNIASLVVAPEHQRKGIGRLLLSSALHECGEHVVTVSTGARNTPALALYAEFGFAECRRCKVGPEGLELVKLRRTRS